MPTVRRAAPADFETVMELLDDSIRWLRDRESDQWSTAHLWPPKMRAALDAGDVWLLVDDGTPVGTVTLDTAGDAEFWTAAELAEPALYLSKLAVARDRAGDELGALLLDWAADRAWRQGHTWLRLDAWKTNEGLHRYYRDRGWAYLRTSALPHRHSGALFQRPAAELPEGVAVRDYATPSMVVSSNSGRWDPDAAGNWMPHHTHTIPGLIIDHPVMGEWPPQLMPGIRYRIRPERGGWVFEQEPVLGCWKPVGPALTVPTGLLRPGSTTVITHMAAHPCGLAVDIAACAERQHIAA